MEILDFFKMNHKKVVIKQLFNNFYIKKQNIEKTLIYKNKMKLENEF